MDWAPMSSLKDRKNKRNSKTLAKSPAKPARSSGGAARSRRASGKPEPTLQKALTRRTESKPSKPIEKARSVPATVAKRTTEKTKTVAAKTGKAGGKAASSKQAKQIVPAKTKTNGAAKPERAPIIIATVAPKSAAMTTSMTKQSTNGTAAARPSKAVPGAKSGEIVLPQGYRPSDGEPFMNERQRMYFRNKLTAWKEDIVRQNMETLTGLHEESSQHADLTDRASSETDRALELRARDRQRKLVSKIDAALARIEDGSYGYCEETGEPISLKRLDARPIATLSLEAQERHERRERVFRED